MTTAGQMRIRFGAATLHLQNCIGEEKVARAKQEVSVLTHMASSCVFSAIEKDSLTLMIINAPVETWLPSQRSEILKAMDETLSKRRRQSQDYSDYMCHVFTESEWNRWKSNGTNMTNHTAEELMFRLKSVGAKNLDEFSKKKLACIWMFLRGDVKEMGAIQRNVCVEQFKGKWARGSREFEPESYLLKFPSMQEFANDYPLMYARAYSTHLPGPLPLCDIYEIDLIHNSMRCRGGSVVREMSVDQQVHRMPQHAGQQQGELANMIAQMMSGRVGNVDAIPGMHYFGQHGGRQMRCAGNLGAGRLALQDHVPLQYALAAPPPNAAFCAEAAAAAAAAMPTDAVDAAAAATSSSVKGIGATSDTRDSADCVAKKLLARHKAKEDDEVEASDDDDDDDDVRTPKVAKKPAGKLSPVKVAKPTGKGAAAKAMFDVTAKADVAVKKTMVKKHELWPKKPSIGWELSRLQCMCRSGKLGPGSSKRISFAEAGGKVKAWALAEKWLAKTMKEYEARGG